MVPFEFLFVVVDYFRYLIAHDLGQAVLNLFCLIDSPFDWSSGLRMAFSLRRIEIAELNWYCMDLLEVIKFFDFSIKNQHLQIHQVDSKHAIAT